MTLKRPGRDVQKFIIIFHVNVSRSRKRSHKSETGREDGQTSGETSPQSKDGKGVADWMARSINPRCNWPKEGWRGTERGVGLIEMYGEQWTTLRRRRPGRAWFHDGGNNGILVTLASTRRFLSGPRDASAPPRLSRSFSLSLSSQPHSYEKARNSEKKESKHASDSVTMFHGNIFEGARACLRLCPPDFDASFHRTKSTECRASRESLENYKSAVSTSFGSVPNSSALIISRLILFLGV